MTIKILFLLGTFGRIDDRALTAHGSRRQARLIDMQRSQNVHHVLALAKQVIGDDPPMTSPPDGLGAHDGAAVPGAQLSELGETGGKGHR